MTASKQAPTRFADLDDAAAHLAAVVGDMTGVDQVAGLGDTALPIAQVIAARLDVPLVMIGLDRGEQPTVQVAETGWGDHVLVVDRGVETGQSALQAVRALRERGVSRVTLAVPVCPRQAEATLALSYDEVIAVHRPLARRSLQWHYRAPLQ